MLTHEDCDDDCCASCGVAGSSSALSLCCTCFSIAANTVSHMLAVRADVFSYSTSRAAVHEMFLHYCSVGHVVRPRLLRVPVVAAMFAGFSAARAHEMEPREFQSLYKRSGVLFLLVEGGYPCDGTSCSVRLRMCSLLVLCPLIGTSVSVPGSAT